MSRFPLQADHPSPRNLFVNSRSRSFISASNGPKEWHESCTLLGRNAITTAAEHIGGVVLDSKFSSAKEPTMSYRSVNQATGEVLKDFTQHTDEQMWDALATADKAFRSWGSRPISERSKIIGRSAQILLEKKEELARLATLEMGKRIAESRGEVELSAS